jgi:hypothetical protein
MEANMSAATVTQQYTTGIKEFHDASYISRLFSKIAKQRSIEVIVRTQEQEQVAKMEALNLKGTEFKLLGIDTTDNEVDIGMIHNGYTYSFKTNMDKNGIIHTPDTLLMYNKRALERHKITDKVAGYIEIYDERYKIIDIHTKGVAFNAKSDVLGQDIIRDVRVVLDSATLYVDIQIAYHERNETGNIYGAKFVSIAWADTMQIVKCVLNDNYSSMVDMGEANKNELYNIFNESGYFNLEQRGLSIHFDDMYDTLQLIDSEKQLSKSFMYKQNDKIMACLNAIRMYYYTLL